LADSSLAELEQSLDQQLGTNMKDQAKELYFTLTQFNNKLKRLAANKGLDSGENLERHIAMLLRRLLQEQVPSLANPNIGEVAATSPAAKAKTPAQKKPSEPKADAPKKNP